VQYVFLTLTDAAIYGLLGLAVTLIVGLTGLVNFAQADIMAFSAFTIYLVASVLRAPLLIAVVAGVAVGAVMTFGFERVLFRFTFRTPISGFLISLGLVLVIENSLTYLNGSGAQQARPYVQGSFVFLGMPGQWQELVAILIGGGVLGGVTAVLRWTRWGLNVRAMATDRETAASLGVNVSRNIAIIFGLSGAVSAIAGALIWTLFPIYSTMGSDYILLAFAVALLGGVGSAGGATIASLIVATAQTGLIVSGLSAWESAAGFGVFILVLLIRPAGFAGVPAALSGVQ